MNDLIKVNRDGTGKQTVNARDLHDFLENKRNFSNWIAERIHDYGFNQDIDFTTVLSKSTGGRPSKEYHISLDMAKELSMVERNEKGKQARQYFIECERRAKDPVAALNDPATMRQLLLTYSEKVISLESTVEQQRPKVMAFDRLATANGSICITDAAKTLQIHPIKNLFNWMSFSDWIYKRAGGKGNWLAYQRRIKQGVLEHKIRPIPMEDGTEKTSFQVLVTPKGLSVLAQVFERKDNIFSV